MANLNGIRLSPEFAVPFVVIDDNKPINFIDNLQFSLYTSVTIVTNSQVRYAKVNGKLMSYKGNNVFSLELTNLIPGNGITVQVYNNSGNLLDYRNYTIH